MSNSETHSPNNEEILNRIKGSRVLSEALLSSTPESLLRTLYMFDFVGISPKKAEKLIELGIDLQKISSTSIEEFFMLPEIDIEDVEKIIKLKSII